MNAGSRNEQAVGFEINFLPKVLMSSFFSSSSSIILINFAENSIHFFLFLHFQVLAHDVMILILSNLLNTIMAKQEHV